MQDLDDSIDEPMSESYIYGSLIEKKNNDYVEEYNPGKMILIKITIIIVIRV
jgi:hypothetical protein